LNNPLNKLPLTYHSKLVDEDPAVFRVGRKEIAFMAFPTPWARDPMIGKFSMGPRVLVITLKIG
jgi:hypothetical protein